MPVTSHLRKQAYARTHQRPAACERAGDAEEADMIDLVIAALVVGLVAGLLGIGARSILFALRRHRRPASTRTGADGP